MENELPDGWILSPPFDIARKIRGVSYNTNEISYSPGAGLIPVMRANNIDYNRLNYQDLVYVPGKSISQNQLLQTGDVVIAMSSGSKNLVGKASQFFDNIKISFGAFCGALRPSKEIDGKYFGYYFQGKEYRNTISELSAGTNINNLKNEHFETLRIPLPPLAEQHRIVAKLDAVMQKVEANKQRLDKIPKLLKRFRQSVLAAAVSGKLTEEWRRKSNFKNLFQLSSRYVIDDSYKEIDDLPKNWKWVALGNYVKCERGRFSVRPRNDPRYFGGKIPFIQIGDLPREGGFVKTHTQTLNSAGLKVSKMFPIETLAIAIVGATIGNTGILAYDMCFTDSMVGMNKGDLDLNLFLDYYLRIEKENFRQLSYAGGGQPNIKLELLNAYPFPLPPLEEQKEIIRRVEQLFVFADKLEVRYSKAKVMLDKLPQSILAKAFRGELVAQDPNDEPASVLLERIREEKTKLAQQKNEKKLKSTSVKGKTTFGIRAKAKQMG